MIRRCGVATLQGLSPRVRRHLLGRFSRFPHSGSISACAEAPETLGATVSQREVYLRVCGGTIGTSHPFSMPNGLSPRVRRHPTGDDEYDVLRRSISACAEAPSSGPRCLSRSRVYLRVCGGTTAI